MAKWWIGCGSVGCLFDFISGPFENEDSAIESDLDFADYDDEESTVTVEEIEADLKESGIWYDPQPTSLFHIEVWRDDSLPDDTGD